MKHPASQVGYPMFLRNLAHPAEIHTIQMEKLCYRCSAIYSKIPLLSELVYIFNIK